MRVLRKASRCLRRSVPVVLIWILGIFLCAAFLGKAGVVQIYFKNANLTNTGNIFHVNSRLLKTKNSENQNVDNGVAERSAVDHPILKRIVTSNAGNLSYISKGSEGVLDSSRGQFKVVEKYLKKKEHGYFVEIGTEGDSSVSLTHTLERERGWKGLVIEPFTRKFESLTNMKRNSNLLQSCINTTAGDWPGNELDSEPCLNLQDVLKVIQRDKIDLLVLDAFGWEYEILSSFPFKDVLVSMISVELHGTGSKPVNKLLDELRPLFDSVLTMTNHIYWRTDVIFVNKNIKL